MFVGSVRSMCSVVAAHNLENKKSEDFSSCSSGLENMDGSDGSKRWAKWCMLCLEPKTKHYKNCVYIEACLMQCLVFTAVQYHRLLSHRPLKCQTAVPE